MVPVIAGFDELTLTLYPIPGIVFRGIDTDILPATVAATVPNTIGAVKLPDASLN